MKLKLMDGRKVFRHDGDKAEIDCKAVIAFALTDYGIGVMEYNPDEFIEDKYITAYAMSVVDLLDTITKNANPDVNTLITFAIKKIFSSYLGNKGAAHLLAVMAESCAKEAVLNEEDS